MLLKIRNKIELVDDSLGQSGGLSNSGGIDWTYSGNSSEKNNEVGEIPDDFSISNANKFVYELKNGNNFDVNIQQDILRVGNDEVSSVHIFCYETTVGKPYRLPVRFDVVIDEVDLVLASSSDFTLGNIKNLSSDIIINNISVPSGSKANLVIIVATKEL